MTEDEQTQLMGSVAAELAAVRRELACLQAKADNYLRVLARASATIQNGFDDNGLPDPAAWPSIEQLDGLCCEINEARSRRHQLTTRLREWGVIE